MANFWNSWFGQKPPDLESIRKEVQAISEKTPTPCLWLLGKTGSGKTSIVRYLTDADDAVIGQGFRPQTMSTRRYDFPTSEEPLLTFLDTRGIGEASYNPELDLEICSQASHLVIVTVRVTDHALEQVVEPVRKIRERNPTKPILLAVTCLHHVSRNLSLSSRQDPFVKSSKGPHVELVDGYELNSDLKRQLEEKVKQFSGLYDVLVPIDLTHPEDGFEDPNFGGDRLKFAIIEALPQAYRQALIVMESGMSAKPNSRQQKARWQVLASSSIAATAGASPIPWLDIPAVLAIQAHLAYKIAEIYDQEITAANWAILSSAAGGSAAAQMLVRGSLKFIPFVGMAAGAATSFASTYALGMSWDWYFANIRKGRVPSAEQLREVYADQLASGRKLWGVENK